MATRIQLRRGTSLDWAVADPILAEGEIGLATDLGRLKVGDGVTAWSALGYYDLDLDQAVAAALPQDYGADNRFVTEAILDQAIDTLGTQYGPPPIAVVTAPSLQPQNNVNYVCSNDVELLEPDLPEGALFACRLRLAAGALVTYPEGWYLAGYCPADKPYIVELSSADGATIHANVIPFEYTTGSGASAAESIKVATWGDDANDGTTWNTAKLSVDAGAAAAKVAGRQLWIGAGLYNAPADEGFHFDGQIKVYGGFQGDEESLAERARTPDPDGRGCAQYAHPTVLRNRIADRAGALSVLSTDTEEGYGPTFEGISFLDSPRVNKPTCAATFIDCFISGMAATGQNGALSISNLFGCTVTGNTAQYGGGLYNCSASDSKITYNVSSLHGGGAYGGVLVNCLVDHNSTASGLATDGHGAGLYYPTSASNCTISNNYAAQRGSGAGVWGNSSYTTLSNCIITRNRAYNGSGGGAGNCQTISDCMVTYNEAEYAGAGGAAGGGLYNNVTVYRTLIQGNTCYFSGTEAAAGCAGGCTYYFCTIKENVGKHYSTRVVAGSGGGSITGAFYGCWFIGNQAHNGAGYCATLTTPKGLYNCVFARNHCTGDTASTPVSAFSAGSAGLEVINCSFIHNQCVGGTGSRYTGNGSSVTMYNCFFWRNNGEADVSSGTKANNKVEADLGLADFDSPVDIATGLPADAGAFDERLLAGGWKPAASGALLNTGDSGRNATTVDILQLNRKVGVIDIGAFERQA